MRRGCVIITVLLTAVIVLGGYFGYRYLRDALDIPEELMAYGDRDSVMARIENKGPAPGASEHLTPERVGLFIGAIDPVASGWHGFVAALDSMNLRADGDSSDINVMTTPLLIGELMKLPLVTRRELVAYLNEHGLSLGEYTWLKERTVAASGITRKEYDAALQAMFRRYVSSKNVATIRDSHDAEELFTRVEALRSSGAIDSSDIALATPYRSLLLGKGLPVLLNIEEDFDTD